MSALITTPFTGVPTAILADAEIKRLQARTEEMKRQVLAIAEKGLDEAVKNGDVSEDKIKKIKAKYSAKTVIKDLVLFMIPILGIIRHAKKGSDVENALRDYIAAKEELDTALKNKVVDKAMTASTESLEALEDFMDSFSS